MANDAPMQQPRNPWLRYSRLLSAELPYDKRQEVWRDDFSAIMPWAPFYYGAIKKWIGSGTQQEEAVITAGKVKRSQQGKVLFGRGKINCWYKHPRFRLSRDMQL